MPLLINPVNLSQIKNCHISKYLFGWKGYFSFYALFWGDGEKQIALWDPTLKYTGPSLRAQLIGKTQSTRSHRALEIVLQNYMHRLPSRHRIRLHVLILTIIKSLHMLCIGLSSAAGQAEERGVPRSSTSFCCCDKNTLQKGCVWLTDHSLLLREVKAGTEAETWNRNCGETFLPCLLGSWLTHLQVHASLAFLNSPGSPCQRVMPPTVD